MIDGFSEIMTLEETAKYLKIGKSTLYKMAREGKIPAVKIASSETYLKNPIIDYWLFVSNRLFKKFKVISEIYLVGSAILGRFDNDIDSVIIVENKYTLKDLKNLRADMQNYIYEYDFKNIYHFKLFDVKELQLLGYYDGFRAYEFKTSRLSIKGKSYLKAIKPLLSFKNFCNSIFIQFVYEYFNKKMQFPLANDCAKSKIYYRILRNKFILVCFNKHPFPLIRKSEFEIIKKCQKYNELFSLFYGLSKITKNDDEANKKLLWLMSRYFKRYRHEFINKYDEYMKLLKRRG